MVQALEPNTPPLVKDQSRSLSTLLGARRELAWHVEQIMREAMPHWIREILGEGICNHVGLADVTVRVRF